VLWSHHHALMDGWGLPILFAEFTAFYQALQAGDDIQLPLPRPYRDHVSWLASRDVQAGEAFWTRELLGIEGPTPLPVRRDGRKGEGISEVTLNLTETQTAQLEQLARDTRTTVNILLQAAWGYVLSCYADESAVVFGTTVSGRPGELVGVEKMVGLFISTIAVRVDIVPNTKVTDWLQTLHQAQVSRDEYSYVPLGELQRISAAHGSKEGGQFDSLLVYENYPVDEALAHRTQASGLVVGGVDGFEHTDYGLALCVALSGVLKIKLQSQKAQFSDEMPVQLLNQLHQVLKAMAVRPDGLVNDLPLLSKDEQNELLNTFNDTQCDYQQHLCIHQVFERQAKQSPDNVAVVFEQTQLSYRELNEKANQLARYLLDQGLQEKGVKPDTLVGLCVERSTDMMIGILAVLKAGGAYVPLDPNYPQSRLDYMVKDSGITVLLSQTALKGVIKAEGLTTINLDEPQLFADYAVTNPLTPV
ncbi:MAG: condensation domain-containing protein, partial [Psychrosphaera sp.]|nr:condensation domain-containing protein [Psychrosphaera sp.]